MKKIILVAVLTLSAVVAYSQTDSIGVYSVRGGSVQRVEMIKPISTKVSSGIVSGKAKLQFVNTTSETVFNGPAKFRIFYAVPSPYDAAKYFMFTPAYSVKDLSVAKFDIKKEMRYLTSSTVSIIGGSTIGTKKAKDIKIEAKQIRPNVYEITITGPAGEYCLLPVLNGMATAHAGVFDFTIK